jgi:hypothetical protein
MRFPGTLGAYLGESFIVLSRLNERKKRQQNERIKLSLKRLMRHLDELLMGKQ